LGDFVQSPNAGLVHRRRAARTPQ